jgi:hypothetical protein
MEEMRRALRACGGKIKACGKKIKVKAPRSRRKYKNKVGKSIMHKKHVATRLRVAVGRQVKRRRE